MRDAPGTMTPMPDRTTPTGRTSTRLIILRGNSGSGKSSIARAVRDRYGRGCALIEQDHLRRIVLKERDLDGGNAAALIDQTVRFCLDVGHHVICEGILHSRRYGSMLTDLIRDHRGNTSVFYLDVPLAETLRRHAGRPQATQFTPQDMRSWYLPHDVLDVPGEHILGEDTTFDDAVDLVAGHLPPTDHPADDRPTPPPTDQGGAPPGDLRDTTGPRETTTDAVGPSSAAARRAYNQSLPRKRAAAAVLFTDPRGHVLIVKPTYKPGWEIPGGAVEDDESPYDAAVREIAEELGLDHRPGALLALDYVAATPERSDGLMVVFDGGTLPDSTVLRLPADELSAHAFVHPDQLGDHLPAHLGRRALAALAARHDRAAYLHGGRPTTAPRPRSPTPAE